MGRLDFEIKKKLSVKFILYTSHGTETGIVQVLKFSSGNVFYFKVLLYGHLLLDLPIDLFLNKTNFSRHNYVFMLLVLTTVRSC